MEVLARIISFLFALTIGGIGTLLLSRVKNIIIRLIIGLFLYSYLSLWIWNTFTVQFDLTSKSNSKEVSPSPSPNNSPSIEMLSEGELLKRINSMENSKYYHMRFITRGGCLDEIKKQASLDNYSDDYEILSKLQKK